MQAADDEAECTGGQREVFEVDPPIWVVTSDRELRERVRDRAGRIIGGGAFARELRER